MAAKRITQSSINWAALSERVPEHQRIIGKEHISILGITETWLSDRIDENLVNIPDFDFFRADGGGRGGGVGAYVRSSLKALCIKLDQPASELQSLWLSVNISGLKIIVGILYRPPTYKNLYASINMIDSCLQEVRPKYDELILLGDLNINLLNQPSETYILTQIVANPTSKTSLLDIIATSNTGMHEISDHHLTLCALSLKHQKQPTIHSIYVDAFQADLLSLDWRYLYIAEHIDNKVEILNNKLLYLFNLHAPLITRKITKSKVEWYTDCIKMMVRERNERLTKYKHTKSEIRHGPEKLWSTLQEFHVYYKSSNNLQENLSDPNLVNQYFVQSIESISSEIHEATLHYSPTRRLSGNPNIFYFTKVNEGVICEAVNPIRSNSTGSDGINSHMLKLCFPVVIPHLRHLYNTCINMYFPSKGKIAAVVSMPKLRNATNLNQLRPISLLPVISKVFEKMMANRIKNYLIERKIQPNIQSGFRQGNSTTTAMLKIVVSILEAQDSDELTALVLLDYSKAFDLVEHKLLIAKFSTRCRNLIQSCLKDRYQYVVINNMQSDILKMNKGVPQGSVLGLLLFVLYTIDLCHNIQDCSLHQFADDR
nr:unnamed protein product [Callosobruchus analis]